MKNQVIIGYVTEGTTDTRFLENIIQRSFEDVAFECRGQMEILPVQHIKKETKSKFIDAIKQCAQQARKIGVTILCIHVDADNRSDKIVFERKINPVFQECSRLSGEAYCNNLVAIVPIQMTEAWMLADTALLKDEIGTDKGDTELGIHRNVEDYKDPKEAIKTAIRIARQELTKRRRHKLKIDELYSQIGQKIDLNALGNVSSYKKFQNAIRIAYRELNFLN